MVYTGTFIPSARVKMKTEVLKADMDTMRNTILTVIYPTKWLFRVIKM